MSLLATTCARIAAPTRDVAGAHAATPRRQDQAAPQPGRLGGDRAYRVAAMRGEERPALPEKAIVVMAGGGSRRRGGGRSARTRRRSRGRCCSTSCAAGGDQRARAARGRAARGGRHGRRGRSGRGERRRRGASRPARGASPHGPAMAHDEAVRALEGRHRARARARGVGRDARRHRRDGIANTTSASALIGARRRSLVERATGRGTGVGDGVAAKVEVIHGARSPATTPDADDARCAREARGFEIAGPRTLVLGAAAERVPVVLDGLIASAAALVAVRLARRARTSCSRRTARSSRGHGPLLDALGLARCSTSSCASGEEPVPRLALQVWSRRRCASCTKWRASPTPASPTAVRAGGGA